VYSSRDLVFCSKNSQKVLGKFACVCDEQRWREIYLFIFTFVYKNALADTYMNINTGGLGSTQLADPLQLV
jgi:hypothetical protein